MNETITRVKSLASEFSDQLEKKTRSNGTRFWCLKDNAPKWMLDAVREAHGDLLPDDHVYRFVYEALSAIEDYETIDDAKCSIESDIYTHQLLAWLNSNLTRVATCDDAICELGIDPDADLITRISNGQWYEKNLVFDSILCSLEQHAEG